MDSWLAIRPRDTGLLADELRAYVVSLNDLNLMGCVKARAWVDSQQTAGVQLVLSDGLIHVETAIITWYLDDPEMTQEKISKRLASELGACVKERAEKAFLGSSYDDDGSPVLLVEEISGENVIRI